MNSENEKVLKVVDEALVKYGSDMLSVDLSESDEILSVNIHDRHSSSPFMRSIARFEKCDISELEYELDKRNVGFCW